MNTGFKNLDKLIDIKQPQVIMLVGKYSNPDILSGDIANHVCLEQEIPVLEIVSSRKEYLIKRLFVNAAKVNYNKWTRKDQYSDKELKQIGRSTVDLIETTKILPTIIEEEDLRYSRKKIKQVVFDFANEFVDHPMLDCLIVLDLFEMNCFGKRDKEYEKREIKIIKDMKRISSIMQCPIIITKSVDYINEDKIQLEEIRNFNKIKKCVDTFITINENDKNDLMYDLEVFNKYEVIGNTKIQYNSEIRKFIELKQNHIY